MPTERERCTPKRKALRRTGTCIARHGRTRLWLLRCTKHRMPPSVMPAPNQWAKSERSRTLAARKRLGNVLRVSSASSTSTLIRDADSCRVSIPPATVDAGMTFAPNHRRCTRATLPATLRPNPDPAATGAATTSVALLPVVSGSLTCTANACQERLHLVDVQPVPAGHRSGCAQPCLAASTSRRQTPHCPSTHAGSTRIDAVQGHTQQGLAP